MRQLPRDPQGGEERYPEFEFHLTKPVPELCASCHDLKDAALLKTHQGQPIAGSNCTNCHDPHTSKSPKLLQKYVHPVFDAQSCPTCHEAPKDGKVVLNQADSRALCVSCHDEAAKKMEAAKVQHPGTAGECTQCHNPHAGRYPENVAAQPGGCLRELPL